MDVVKLRVKMLEKGISQQELALEAGISASSLSRKLKEVSQFRINEVRNICNTLGITDPCEACDIFLS